MCLNMFKRNQIHLNKLSICYQYLSIICLFSNLWKLQTSVHGSFPFGADTLPSDLIVLISIMRFKSRQLTPRSPAQALFTYVVHA